MASIADVAKKAKVSVTTVSRAMNDHPYVSKKTKEKIKRAMEELGYFPNSGAQQLRGKSTKLIGVIVSYITNPFFSYLVAHIEKTATALGYHPIILQTLEDIEREKLFITMLKRKQLDGIIAASLEANTPDVIEMVKKGDIVLCNRSLIYEDLPMIQIDEAEVSETAAAYLFDKGYQNIGFCLGGPELHASDRRFKGFLDAHEAKGKIFNPDYFFRQYRTIPDGRRLFHTLANMNQRPDAIFANSDEVAAGLMEEALQHGWRIPEDLAVIGFDDQPIATIVTPKLTTVRQPIQEMAEQATHTLLAHLEGKEIPEFPPLQATFIPRSST